MSAFVRIKMKWHSQPEPRTSEQTMKNRNVYVCVCVNGLKLTIYLPLVSRRRRRSGRHAGK